MAISWRVLAASALASGGAAAMAQPFADNFDGYAAGSNIAGQGGWSVWYSGGVDATVSTEQAASGANSLRLAALSDIVQQFNATSGRWRFSVNVYIPSNAGGGTREMYIILLNQYGGTDNWSVQTRFNLDNLVIESQYGGQTTTLIPDHWTAFAAEFDLDNDDLDIYIDGAPLVENARWTTNTSGNGILALAACDLFSNGIDGAFLDDVRLEALPPACAADFNGDGFLDFFDYLDYVSCFEDANCPPGTDADFNGDGFADFFDYADFVTAFEAGC